MYYHRYYARIIVMFDILSLIPGRKKRTSSGWTSFNAICCVHRGHKPDKRGRGGIRFENSTNWVYHCFNCGFKCSFKLGRSIHHNTRQLLSYCGIDDVDIQRWNIESLQQKDLLDLTETKYVKNKITFKEFKLPQKCELLDVNTQKHKLYTEYLKSRKVDLDRYKFYVTPNDEMERNKQRIIVPYMYKDKIVGCTSRYLDKKSPKYINEQQPGYVFNIDKQKRDWSVCIVTEGIFDAISIDGVAVMHDDINDEQFRLLQNLNRRIIVVPDQDKTGLKMIDRALELGFSVSLPKWEHGIKDVNDAVVRYGKLPTLLSILQNSTMSRIKLEMRKKQIDKGL